MIDKYDVYFKDPLKERLSIGKACNRSEVLLLVDTYLQKHSPTTIFYHMYKVGDEWCIDCGTYGSFYVSAKQINLLQY